ncbi:MAG: nuclear transport factor 2 family protein [Acidobacteriaceae bacterium]|nr:nuclear transport factor 2 family protein [Acidobacteriaceae bacterium]
MKDTSELLAAEREFFSSLTTPNLPVLGRLLSDDFSLVDLSGAILDRSSLLAVIESGQIRFEVIQPIESTVRFYQSIAVVTGRTQMSGHFGGIPFTAKSRYTHVYAEQEGRWQLAAAQGTPILAE